MLETVETHVERSVAARGFVGTRGSNSLPRPVPNSGYNIVVAVYEYNLRFVNVFVNRSHYVGRGAAAAASLTRRCPRSLEPPITIMRHETPNECLLQRIVTLFCAYYFANMLHTQRSQYVPAFKTLVQGRRRAEGSHGVRTPSVNLCHLW